MIFSFNNSEILFKINGELMIIIKKNILKKSILIVLFTISISSLIFSFITGSAHDFSDDAWNLGGEICQPCHTPHNGGIDITSTIAPLWNHQETNANVVVAYIH